MDLTEENLLPFDKLLRNERIKIELLDYNMKAIDSIEGIVINGQISVNANNDIRRTGSITLCVPIDNSKTTFLDSINDVEISADGKIWIDKNIKIYIGIDKKENGITSTIWYKMGVFLFDQPVRNFSSNNYEISFNCIDRMVLLTGDRQGQFTGVSATIPAGEYVDSSDFNQTQILSPSEEEPLLFGRNMDKNPEGTQIAIIVEDGTVGSGIVKFYELVEGIFTAMSPPLTIPSSGITAVKYRPDGQQFVIATESAGIYIYDCTSVPYTYLGTLSSNVINPISLDFSPDSTEFICGAGIETSNIISRFDTSTTPYTFKSYCSLSGYEKAISKCVYSPDGVLIVCNIAINSINNLDGLPSMIAFQDSTYINFLDEDYYTSYKKSLSRDFCFSSDGKKFTILVDKYPYFLSFQTKIIPYIMDNMPLSIPTQEMYFCKYFDNDTKIFMGISNLRGNDDESYLYSCISNHYVQLSYNPMEINTLINDEIAFNVSQIGFMSNKLLLTGYCTFPRAFSLVCNIIESSTYLRTLTRDALTSVIKDLTTITKFTIAEIPNDFKYLPYDITVTTGDTVNSILKKFKDILSSWQFYFDLDGVFRIEQIRSGVNAPIMPVEYKTYVDGQLAYDFGNVKNQVVVYGKLNDCHKFCSNDEIIYSTINPLETELNEKWLCKKYSFDIYNIQISGVDRITYSQSLELFAGLKDGDIYTSQNGYTWTKVNDDSAYIEIIWSKTFSKFIAIGELSWTYSLDGTTWVADDFDFTMPPSGIVDTGSTVFVGLQNDYEVYPDKQCFRYTTDGINWSSILSSVAIYVDSIATSPSLIYTTNFVDKIWTGFTTFWGYDIWTDGIDTYYSGYENQYTLDTTTSTWAVKTWTGLTYFYGRYIWKEGNNIYCSMGTTQKILNIEASTWSDKTWSGLTNFDGDNIWKDNEGNIYYSDGTTHYVLDIETSTWSVKTWTGLASINSEYVWTDGIKTYYSSGTNHYELDSTTSTWSVKTWGGLTNFYGNRVWTNGINYFCPDTTNQYVLNTVTSVWTDSGLIGNYSGRYIWTDNTNYYYSDGTTQYSIRFNSNEKVIAIGRNTETVQPIALEYDIITSILNEFSTGITSQESIAFGLVYDESGQEIRVFVSVGGSKKGGYSNDGVVWEEIDLPLSADCVSFVGNYNSSGDNIARKNVDGYFIASASGSENKIMSSRDGKVWSIIDKGNFTGIAFNDEKFVGCSGADCYIGYKNYETLIPEENINYVVPIYYPNAQPTLKYFTWNGTVYVEQTALQNINVEYNSNVLTLKFDTFDFSTLTIDAFNIGFKSISKTNLVDIDTLVLYNLENDTQISGTITSFEGNPKYVSANTLEPNEIYIIKVSKAILNEDGKVDTNYPITFELYSRQQPSSCLINDNKESPFYINKNLSGENYYAGVAETPNSLNVGEGYKLTLNNTEELLSLESGTLITFMANYTNSYQKYLNYTSITICSGFDDSIILENIPIVQNELYRSDEGTTRLPLQEGKMTNNYTCYMLKYDSVHSQFIFMGINTSAYSLVLTGGDYDSIYSDQLAYERCLWELYLHSNLQDTISLTIIPNYMLDVNMKIPFKKKYQYPISSKATDIDEGYDYYLIKQLSFYLGSSGSGTKVVGLKIYDSGNLLPD